MNLSNYLARLEASAAALRDFEHWLMHGPRPVLLVHFGDHLPAFDGLITPLVKSTPPGYDAQANNLTYYAISRNFAGPAPTTPDVLDIALLPGLILEAAGLRPGRISPHRANCGGAAQGGSCCARTRGSCRPTSTAC